LLPHPPHAFLYKNPHSTVLWTILDLSASLWSHGSLQPVLIHCFQTLPILTASPSQHVNMFTIRKFFWASVSRVLEFHTQARLSHWRLDWAQCLSKHLHFMFDLKLQSSNHGLSFLVANCHPEAT
jgi:hypothetical protein